MLVDSLDLCRVRTGLDASSKETALRAIASLLVKPEETLNEEIVYDALAERERLASTGVGNGVAVPHARLEGLKGLRAAVAVHKAGVDFKAIDGLPVHILVGILGPRSEPQKHLALLAQVSRALRVRSNREALIAAASEQEAHELILRM
jgi:PTS system nitrogen regulatory IIA component